MNGPWFASDHHFGHANSLKFLREDGTPMRPGFSDVHHMDETMIANHNRVVAPTDLVYFLGDVGFGKATLAAVLPRLNGRKRLILGNHDYSDRQMMRFYLAAAEYKYWTDPALVEKLPIAAMRDRGLLAVEMEAAALYAFAGGPPEAGDLFRPSIRSPPAFARLKSQSVISKGRGGRGEGDERRNLSQCRDHHAEHFQKVMSWRHFTESDCALICTHFPLHESSFLGRYAGACINVHGHIHARRINDPRYVNICVEQINYTPVSYDWLIAKARAAGR